MYRTDCIELSWPRQTLAVDIDRTGRYKKSYVIRYTGVDATYTGCVSEQENGLESDENVKLTCQPVQPSSPSIYAVNTLRSRQNSRHFADDTFKSIFLGENEWISIKIPPKFIPKDPINNIPAWFREWLGAGQATSHCLNQW